MTTSPQLLLVGSPVTQSKSPVFQNAALQAIGSYWSYGVEDVDQTGLIEVIDRIRSGAIIGANVTMPHKQLAYESCDCPSPIATALKAVNTLYRDQEGRVAGANTDVHGVARSITALGCATRSVVLLGAGGAAAAAIAAVGGVASDLVIINRNTQRARDLANRLSAHELGPARVQVAEWGTDAARGFVRGADLIINATALGMRDALAAEESFRLLDVHRSEAALLDLIYSMVETPFLGLGAERAKLDGATMLVEQGARSFELWTGSPAPLKEMYVALFSSLGRPVPTVVESGAQDEDPDIA